MNNRYPRHIFLASLACAVIRNTDDATAGGGLLTEQPAAPKLNPMFAQFETDPKLEKDGIEIQYTIGDPEYDKNPPTFIVARAGGSNRAYNNMVDHELKPLQRRLRADNVGTEELENLYRKIYSKTIVKGWRNVRDAKNNLIPFSEKNVLEYFNTLPEIYEDIKSQANKVSLYRKHDREETAKN